jgi:hypothetical protein
MKPGGGIRSASRFFCSIHHEPLSPCHRLESGDDSEPSGAPSCHRTNTDSKLGQTATRVSDRNRYRRPAGRITVLETRECLHLPVEGRGRREARWSHWQRIHSKRMPSAFWGQAPQERRAKMKSIMMGLTVLFLFNISAFAQMSTRQGGGMMGGGWGWGMNSGWFVILIIAILLIFWIVYMMKRK